MGLTEGDTRSIVSHVTLDQLQARSDCEAPVFLVGAFTDLLTRHPSLIGHHGPPIYASQPHKALIRSQQALRILNEALLGGHPMINSVHDYAAAGSCLLSGKSLGHVK